MAAAAYQWAHWRFEPSEFRLLRDGVVVPVPAKTLDLLYTLLKRAPRLVTKDEILTSVWPDAAVEAGNIAFHIAALRKMLDEDKGASAIETVRGKGYRFIRELAIHQLPPTEALRREALARAWAEASTPSPVNNRRRLIAALAIVLVGSLGVFAWLRSRLEPFSIAVQPFDIVEPQPGQENFPDGLRSYLTTKMELAGVTIRPLESATAVLSGQLHPLDDRFRVTVQLTRRVDNTREWDWSFDVPLDTDMPSEGQDDARSRLQDAIATRAAEGVRSYVRSTGAATAGGGID